MYAINDKNSFEEVKQLRESIINLRNTKKVPFVVAGNKCDMDASHREVSKETAEKWCQSVKIPHHETSAKTNVNVSEAFDSLVREVRRLKTKRSGGGGGKSAGGKCILV